MSETGEQPPATLQQMGTRPPEPEHLPCPRCDSTNTKFCYYNNYNLSQPRHFCKSCRRYWTRGGTLRNVPVGGGTRKASNKRSRFTTTAAATTTATSSSSSTLTYDPIPANPISTGFKSETGSGPSLFGELNLNESYETMAGSFTSLLSSQQGDGLGGFGLGLGSGIHGIGFGLGTWAHWSSGQVGEGNGGGVGSGGSSGCDTWQIGGVEGGGLSDDGDCFGWPDLAISTPGKGVK